MHFYERVHVCGARDAHQPNRWSTQIECLTQCDSEADCTAVTIDASSTCHFHAAGCEGAAQHGAFWPPYEPMSYRRARTEATLALVGAADAPLLHTAFTADPSARVFDGVLYVIMSHDLTRPNGLRDENAYGMVDYRLIRAQAVDAPIEDLGTPLSVAEVPWASKMMWAPDLHLGADCRYHLLFPAQDHSGVFRLGVAHADAPQGPYVADPQPIAGSSSIDPCIFIDSDGARYAFWGGKWGGQMPEWRNGPLVARLSADMGRFEGAVREVQITGGGNFFEGPWVHKRRGTYYLIYSTGPLHTLVYATATGDPLGPYCYRGVLLTPVEGWTTHGSAGQRLRDPIQPSQAHGPTKPCQTSLAPTEGCCRHSASCACGLSALLGVPLC